VNQEHAQSEIGDFSATLNAGHHQDLTGAVTVVTGSTLDIADRKIAP
jgi:hypothetical protein